MSKLVIDDAIDYTSKTAIENATADTINDY